MKKVLLAVFLCFGTLAFAETWNNVPMIDTQCESKVHNNPDAHTRVCALQCSGKGYGIIASDGTYLKFDQQGNEQALNLLKKSDKTDHIRVSVDGELQGDTIKVKSIKM